MDAGGRNRRAVPNKAQPPGLTSLTWTRPQIRGKSADTQRISKQKRSPSSRHTANQRAANVPQAAGTQQISEQLTVPKQQAHSKSASSNVLQAAGTQQISKQLTFPKQQAHSRSASKQQTRTHKPAARNLFIWTWLNEQTNNPSSNGRRNPNEHSWRECKEGRTKIRTQKFKRT